MKNFNTSKVFAMDWMFKNSQATSLDLSGFDTSNVTYMREIFEGSKATIGYARTSADATKFNATSNKPAGLTIVIKNRIYDINSDSYITEQYRSMSTFKSFGIDDEKLAKVTLEIEDGYELIYKIDMNGNIKSNIISSFDNEVINQNKSDFNFQEEIARINEKILIKQTEDINNLYKKYANY